MGNTSRQASSSIETEIRDRLFVQQTAVQSKRSKTGKLEQKMFV
jgi:hypothetical protein